MISSKERKGGDSDFSKPGARCLYAMNISLLYRGKVSLGVSTFGVELEEE
jgi:hypothetical protein